ncbi:hypothetical protein LJC20_06165, partial [Eubacteriales bacterium OttesenSCG-928-M02]|nr:hypothetical protein [Eubacteriales bacterium OttesenSCG-928-M02]
MKVRIFDSKEELFYAGAMQFMKYALNHPDGLIGLCTGSTTNPIHELIIDIYKACPFDTSQLKTVNADQYVSPKGLEKPLTMRPDMEPLFDALGLDEERGMFPDHLAENPQAECLRYEQRIRDAGGVGLQLLGIGADAHLGFCLPGTPLDAITHT